MSSKYKGHVARIIATYFDWRTNYDFESFLDEIESLINYKRDKLMQMAFRIYDFDSDQSICSLDLCAFLKIYKDDEVTFQQAYTKDLTKI